LAIPFTPIAAAALRYGAVAALAYAAARRATPRRIDPAVETAMDRLPDGVTVGHAPQQMTTTARWRRILPLGLQGPRMEVDLSLLARLRLRRVA